MKRPYFRTDETGHMLVISGVLLMLGFMVLATTLVALNNHENRTLRAQEGAINDDVTNLLEELNQTLQALVPPGALEVQSFVDHSETAQTVLQQEAARSGIYASVKLNEDPPSDSFLRPSRCMGWHPEASQQGVILGWHETTRELGISGAVYDVHMTNGDRAIRLTYYLRLHECIQDRLSTHLMDAWADPGEVTGDWATQQNDTRAMNLTETNLDPILQDVSPTIDPDSYEIHHWNIPDNLHEEDGRTAKFVSSNVRSNHVRFTLQAPPGMRPGDELHNPEFQVTAGHNRAPVNEQALHLQVYYPESATEPRISEEIAPLQVDLETFTLDLPQSPTGGSNWSYDEIVDSKWELTVIGDHNPEREVYVDHFNMTGGLWTSSPYRLSATISWQKVPGIYTDHELNVRYKIEPGTPDEVFILETRDTGPGGNGTWWVVGELTALQEDGAWSWRTFKADLELLGDDEKHLEFRIQDADHGDAREPEDRDTIQVDLMRLESRFDLESG